MKHLIRLLANFRQGVFLWLCTSFGLAEHVSGHPDNDPVENLDEGDDAEAEEEAKESSKGSNEVHWSHPDAPLKLWGSQEG